MKNKNLIIHFLPTEENHCIEEDFKHMVELVVVVSVRVEQISEFKLQCSV